MDVQRSRSAVAWRAGAAVLVLVTCATAVAACRSWKGLVGYDFRGGTLAVMSIAPPRPDVFTGGPLDVYGSDLIGTAIRIGSEVALAIETAELREKLDSAFVLVDVADRMAARTLTQCATYMGARPVDDVADADYILEVRTERYGIEADFWDEGTYYGETGVWYAINAEIVLLDGHTRGEIWKQNVGERDPASASVVGFGPAGSRIWTAAAFARLSVEDIARALEGLADYAADRMARKLRSDLERARREERG